MKIHSAFAALACLTIVLNSIAASTQETATETSTQILNLGGALEILAPVPIQNGAEDNDRGRIRSFEVTGQTKLMGDLRRFAAKATVGGFDDSGDFVLGLREAFVQHTGPRSGIDVRVGRYFLPIGLFNQTRHAAWVTPSGPRFNTRYFGDDGIVDTGVEALWHPGDEVRVRLGVMNGYTFNSGVDGSGVKPQTPTHYLRSTYDTGIGRSLPATISFNYVGRMDDAGKMTRILGVDFTLLRSTSWMGQGEIFSREVKPSGLATERDLAGSVYFEKSLPKNFAAGLRADAFTITSLTNAAGEKSSNFEWALAPVVSYAKSDALKLQAAYTYLSDARSGNSTRHEQVVEFRLVTEIGEIPKFRGLPGDRSSL